MRGSLAGALAVALHLGVLGAVRLAGVPVAVMHRANTAHDEGVVIDLVTAEPEVQTDSTAMGVAPAGPSGSAQTHGAARRAGQVASIAARAPNGPAEAASSEMELSDSDSNAPPAHARDTKKKRRVDLGLGGSATSGLLLGLRGRDTVARQEHSPGMLLEGLAELDARKGIGPAGAAATAAKRAASLYGPNQGSAVFEVRTDAAGLVTGVTLVRFGSNPEAWGAVARRMHAELRRRRLFRAANSRGSVTRLQVATGPQAKPAAGSEGTKRGTALAQGPRHRQDIARDESTRAIMDGPTASPTLGTQVVGPGASKRVRVSVLSVSTPGG